VKNYLISQLKGLIPDLIYQGIEKYVATHGFFQSFSSKTGLCIGFSNKNGPICAERNFLLYSLKID